MSDAYNKFASKGSGTLMSNWFEEQALREFTGYGRNVPAAHVPKDRTGPAYLRSREGNDLRIHGEPIHEKKETFNKYYGRSKNPADALRKVGRREQLMQMEMEGHAKQELAEKEKRDEEARNARMFSTTTQQTFDWKANTESLGKRVMKTQDGLPTESQPEPKVAQTLMLSDKFRSSNIDASLKKSI